MPRRLSHLAEGLCQHVLRTKGGWQVHSPICGNRNDVAVIHSSGLHPYSKRGCEGSGVDPVSPDRRRVGLRSRRMSQEFEHRMAVLHRLVAFVEIAALAHEVAELGPLEEAGRFRVVAKRRACAQSGDRDEAWPRVGRAYATCGSDRCVSDARPSSSGRRAAEPWMPFFLGAATRHTVISRRTITRGRVGEEAAPNRSI